MSDAILERLDRIERFLPIPEYLGVDWIAVKYGVSPSYMRQHKGALPNFGVSDIPGKLAWHRDLCAQWVQTSIRAHLTQFDRLTVREKHQIMANWKVA